MSFRSGTPSDVNCTVQLPHAVMISVVPASRSFARVSSRTRAAASGVANFSRGMPQQSDQSVTDGSRARSHSKARITRSGSAAVSEQPG